MSSDIHAETWDLSDNDRGALRSVLADRRDLLAALRLIIDGLDEVWVTENLNAVDAAVAAIAKAEGKDR